MDNKVVLAQRWVNAAYGAVPGYIRCPEDGEAGPSTWYALIRALQHELGITALSDNFGPGTLGKLEERGGVRPSEQNRGIVGVVQAGLLCHGYAAGEIDGTFGPRAQAAAAALRFDAGLSPAPNGAMEPKLLKALLSPDSHVLVPGGDRRVRAVQRWLNGTYAERKNFLVIACDGVPSRDVYFALYLAVQFELGLSDEQATGNFGQGTRAGLKEHAVGEGDTSRWVRLYSASLIVNGLGTFTDFFDRSLVRATEEFQDFAALPRTGRGDYPTWALLLASNGDLDQPAAACDTATTITPARAKALHAAGYRVVGRYLDERPNGTLDKEIKPGELKTIFEHGLQVFPISQYYGGDRDYFTEAQGRQDARDAHTAALRNGFRPGTVIFFAVDYDATQDEVDYHVVPYFRGVVAGLDAAGGRYRHGVYGSRNVCTQVTKQTKARWSFVAGMSIGYSGNLGFGLPENWAFNQVRTLTTGDGDGKIEIDANTCRPGTDAAVSSVDETDGRPARGA